MAICPSCSKKMNTLDIKCQSCGHDFPRVNDEIKASVEKISLREKHYQQIYDTDRGRGYSAIDYLAGLCYVSIFLYGVFLFMAMTNNKMALAGIAHIPALIIGVYIARLMARSIFAWRDKNAEDVLGK